MQTQAGEKKRERDKKKMAVAFCLYLIEVYCQMFYKLLLKYFHSERKMQH